MSGNDNRLFEKALALLEERRFTEAAEAFSRLVALNPEMVGAYGNRGLAYLNLGLDEQARCDFETVLQLDPDDAMGHSMLAEVGRFEDTPEETLELLNRALELNPNEPQALFIRGWLFAKAGQYDMAVDDLSRFMELVGENDDVQDFLEVCEILAREHPADDAGQLLNTPEKIDRFMGRHGWSFDYEEKPDYEEQGLPCPYAHCIRNRPPLSPEMPGGCPVFGYSCPGRREQVAWCREHHHIYE